MFPMFMLSIAAIGFFCYLLFTIAVFALPFFAGVRAASWAYHTPSASRPKACASSPTCAPPARTHPATAFSSAAPKSAPPGPSSPTKAAITSASGGAAGGRPSARHCPDAHHPPRLPRPRAGHARSSGFYQAPSYTTNIARQYNCGVTATSAGNEDTQSAVANSPSVSGPTALANGNDADTVLNGGGRQGGNRAES